MICNSRFWTGRKEGIRRAEATKRMVREGRGRRADLEAFVLQDLLDGDVADGVGVLKELRLKDDTKRAIADDFAVGVDEITSVSGLAVGGDDLDDLAWIVDGWLCGEDKNGCE